MALRRRRAQEERTGTPADLIVVGLGNPGDQYAGTRHNVGAEVIDLLAERHNGHLRKSKEAALSDEIRIGQARVAIAFPQTFMNRSGESARLLMRRHGVENPAQLVVIHDELDLEPGVVKVKAGGGLAGHNGLRSIRDHLKTQDFTRIRIGVGRPPESIKGADWVLRRPGRSDRPVLDDAVDRGADIVEHLTTADIETAMNLSLIHI